MARQFFSGRLRIEGGISAVQCAVFIGVGLQHKTIDEVAAELDVPINQLLALFNKLIRKLSAHLRSLKEAQVGVDIPTEVRITVQPHISYCTHMHDDN